MKRVNILYDVLEKLHLVIYLLPRSKLLFVMDTFRNFKHITISILQILDCD